LANPSGHITFEKKRHADHGPDYLSAPFDPTATGAGDPLYVLEFKGNARHVKFDHQLFRDWRKQSLNIKATTAAGPVRLKSWVLAFNYAFAGGRGRDCSTLLVEDPWTARPPAEPLEASRSSIELVVRERLARQPSKFGGASLAARVLSGTLPESDNSLPTTYGVRHHALGGRRYIGAFAQWGPNGEIVWTDSPGWSMTLGSSDIDIDVLVDQGTPWLEARVRIRGSGGPVLGRVQVHVHGGVPQNWRAGDLVKLVREAFRRRDDGIFVGQDANMLRDCLHVRVGGSLDGAAFAEPIEVAGRSQATDEQQGGFVQVLRNGSIIADASVVEMKEAGPEWRRSP
jgi:hypothetical protein